jgi:chromosome segregation ATPase
VASGALMADVAAEVERLRAQHADAVQEKSAAESKSRRLAEKVAALGGERTDLRRQLVEERREANQAITKVQTAQAEAKLVRAEESLASQRAEEWEARFNALQAAWRGPRPLRAWKLSGRANSSWTHTAS